MRVVFDEKSNFWKVDVEDKRHSLNVSDFLVLAGLRDRNDRNFHNISELTITSRLDDRILKNGLKKLRKTSLIRSKGKAYRISCFGERLVDMIRNEEVEVVRRNIEFSLSGLRRLVGFEGK
jgi:hypothetical protein